ncbi:hypothetical protein Poli38472_007269 [Pythium oligandrum]|uniref:Uncharacterized protein n=1 Tax=Pythium oligandrum TaxID=41045 RepID=A0A8K1C9D8_PYTOL|nr:hypothetical protein Poli38472_007269 [Pythium oligandrum]|eukprot:TMW59124.1 hypothetical protein Poli38472_007269 [Pythium oligandrum]
MRHRMERFQKATLSKLNTTLHDHPNRVRKALAAGMYSIDPSSTSSAPQGFVNVNGQLLQALSLREHLPQKPSPADARRRRNREAMRRARQRQQVGLEELRSMIRQLETQLGQLKLEKSSQDSGSDSTQSEEEISAAVEKALGVFRRRRVQYSQLLDYADQLREEKRWLSDEIQTFARLFETLRAYSDHSSELTTRLPDEWVDIDGYSLFEQAILSQYQFLSPLQVFDLVKESIQDILHYTTLADACQPSAHKVFGWSDKRFLDGAWATFLVSKDFPGESTQHLADRTWDTSIEFSQYKSIQNWARRMKILQVLNKDTLLITRENVCPDDQSRFHTLYLQFRVETKDGFIVGTRSLDPRKCAGLDTGQTSSTMTTVLYCFMLSRITQDGKEIGCNVKLGGRVGNGRVRYGKTVLMDVLPTTMRWESVCVRPFLSLTS